MVLNLGHQVLSKISTQRTFLSLLMSIFIFLPQVSHSETLSNEALFQRAHKSFAYFMLASGIDPVFMKNLTIDERKIHWELMMFTSSAQTHSWALNRKLETANLVETTHEVKPLSITSFPFPKLQFSIDQNKFNIDPHLPIRTAVTTAENSSVIFINLFKINDPKQSYNLGDAVSLLAHELAHKLQRPDQQAAIDSVATKLKKFVDLNTQVDSFDGFKVHVIKFSDQLIFGWLADLFGVRVTKNPKWIYDQEGFYVFLENESGFHDITEPLLKPFSGYMKLSFDERNIDYQVERLHWFFSDWVRLESRGKNHLRISANLKYIESGLTFMKKNSLDPKGTRPYHSLYLGRPFDGGLVAFVQDIEINKASMKVTKIQEGLIRHVDPTYQTKLIEKSWVNEDLKLVYKIEGSNRLEFPGYRISDIEIWPELLFEFEGQTIEIKANKYDSTKQEYTFIIPRLKFANRGDLFINGLEWAAKKPNLVHGGSSSRVSAFLDQSTKIELKGVKRQSKIVLEKVNPMGEYFELIFQSDEKLRTLDIHQGVSGSEESTYYDTTDTGIRFEVATKTREFDDVKAVVRFDETQMQQILKDGKLVVRVLLDAFVDTDLEEMLEPDLTPEFQSIIKNPDKLTLHKFKIKSDRWFLGYKAQTDSLSVFGEYLENPIYFQKEISKKSTASSCAKAVSK